MPLAVRFHTLGGPEVLELEEVEVPPPGNGEVRIRTRALGLNRAEAMFRTGDYLDDPVLPQGLGYEAAGVVESIGPEVTGFSVGDAVSVIPAFKMTDYAVHGELVLAPARAVVKHPTHLSWEEAASIWMQFITAYGGLIDLAELRRGDVVVIQAASSSVGLAAIQIANMVGARPIALTRTGAKRAQLMAAGASAVISTQDEDITERLDELTGGVGVQVIFDPVGGPILTRLVEAAAAYANVIIYGALDDEPTQLPVLPLIGKRITIRGFNMFDVTWDPSRLERAVTFVRDGLESGALKPTIDVVFELTEIVAAFKHLESNGQVGKVVITVPEVNAA
ncbi:zinc-dependent alcohol dehydrogenase family protein [Mycolicibacterium mengxianglii]|uniref:zinc-dependent alcohol dehydrogenase family protein n=1 Tax=Mycolicibacterium mengxianglii TaxID=2736649 RepID=UPI0018D1A1B3|nr:zinc-dependent alcohol dehydrogenase family protein [Mycolicibacterium mengxianglii]